MQQRLELVIKRLLLAGSWSSTVLLTVGLAAFVADVPFAATVLHLGLLVLMMTPVVRVMVSAGQYLKARDWFFAFTTLAVLAVLTGTLVVALRAARAD